MQTIIGIRREDINRQERRVPLIPSHVGELIRNHGLKFRVQPSGIRIFEDADYAREGAEVMEDLSPCRVIFGLKEIPPDVFEPGKTYVFFSHTIKGQAGNMPMLRRMMERGCTLIDYEKIVDDQGRRLLYFGRHAGHAGMIDALWSLGRRLSWEGLETPFSEIRQASDYAGLTAAREAVAAVGERIRTEGLDERLCPMVFGFLGYGNVSSGAQEVFDLLPFNEVSPGDLEAMAVKKPCNRFRLAKTVFREEDMVRRRDGEGDFVLQEYYDKPDLYRPVFESFLPHLTVVVNGIYWTPRFPRFITREALQEAWRGGRRPRLRVIADITCDVDGAMACTVRSTGPDNPIYVFEPATGATRDGVAGEGPVVLAVYNLPAELPLESSIYFSRGLKAFVPAMALADRTADLDSCGLPEDVKKGVILYRGKLTPDFVYLKNHLT
jgi:saccharopine dehydrogenase (NAD+, L-lysine forming)